MSEKILIVEDQFIEANNLQMILERSGFTVCGIASSVTEALSILEEHSPHIVLLDIFLKGKLTGIDLAKTLLKREIAFVYLSANSNKEVLNAAKATRPYGFLIKPFREKDVLVTLDVARYLHAHRFESKLLSGASEMQVRQSRGAFSNDQGNIFEVNGIVGKSAVMRKVMEHLQIVAPMNTSVLLLGETGTGKEKIADCIHQLSGVKDHPLIKVNCGSLPVNLVESELFGHERGAFTGAVERRIGKFERAAGGTIFLDEIGEMPLDLQVKLLRVLQEKEIERVGGNTAIKINARIIAATNRDLEKEVAEGRFRLDLYYRLNAFPILMPALRERTEDIPLLAEHFVKSFAAQFEKNVKAVSVKVLDLFMNYSWPGNIRELEHMIERSVLLTKDEVITNVDIPEQSRQRQQPDGSLKSMVENEYDHIMAALRKCKGKISGRGGAAELLDLNVSTLNSKMKKLGIDKRVIFRLSG